MKQIEASQKEAVSKTFIILWIKKLQIHLRKFPYISPSAYFSPWNNAELKFFPKNFTAVHNSHFFIEFLPDDVYQNFMVTIGKIFGDPSCKPPQ